MYGTSSQYFTQCLPYFAEHLLSSLMERSISSNVKKITYRYGGSFPNIAGAVQKNDAAISGRSVFVNEKGQSSRHVYE